jgi:hypothetical protein
MSSMLEKAIVDATALREAAVKSAEATIVEKYTDEVKDAVTQLLEQGDDIDLGDDFDEEEPLESTAMEQVPMAHLSDNEEEIVVVDLDDIIAAADAEDDELEEPTLDREEIADEVGLPLADSSEGIPGNRDDNIELDENDLVSMFKEILTVNIPEIEIERAHERLEQDEKEQDERVESVNTDGMDEEDAENLIRNDEKNEQNELLQRENLKLKDLLGQVKNKLQEINLQNARLLYANRVLSDSSLNEQQKNKVAELVSNARSVEEAKLVYETLQKTMAGIKKESPQSLSEVISKRSSVILSGNRKEERTAEKSPTYNRWATLAGTTKTN